MALTAATLIEQIMQYGLEYFKVYHGVYRGIVTDNKDPEQRGRILARVPQVGLSEAPNVWIKPASQGAGVSRGMFWPPEVGDTVFVTFAQGNAARPEAYWGGWFSAPDDVSSVPEEFAYTNEKPETRGLVTRLGQMLLMSDEAGNERIVLQWHRSDPLDLALFDEKSSADRGSGDLAAMTFKPDGSIELKDINESTILLDGDNQQIVVTDVNQNTITTDSEGIAIKDLSENTLTLNGDGIEIKDANSNTVILNGSGITVKDNNGNSVVLSRSGAEIKATAVKIGSGADAPAMRHTDWETWAKAHTHPTAVGPSGPPIVPPLPTIASQVVKVK